MKPFFALLLAVAAAVAACSSGPPDVAESQCDDLHEKDACVATHGCAWGTGRNGPSCFFVGDVKPL